MVTSPSVIPLQNPTLLQDHMAHVLVYQSNMLCKDSQAFSSSDHQLYDLEEKPVGSALAVTYPAACLKASQQVGESITLSGNSTAMVQCWLCSSLALPRLFSIQLLMSQAR